MRIARRLRRREQEINGLYESVRDTTESLDLAGVVRDGVVARMTP